MAIDHVTPTRARDLLERHGLTTRKALGQHILVDPNTVRRIIRLAELSGDDTVLEVGPGLGSLTVGLSAAAGRVIAVEVDPGMVQALSDVVGDLPNVEVVVGDALDIDLAGLCPQGTKLVANLPYNIATPLFARVLEDVPRVTSGLVMVQKELGDRWVAPPGSKTYGAISVKVAYHASAEFAGDVPPTVFQPPPKVSSVLVSFTRHTEPPVDVDDHHAFGALVQEAFGHRRKTIRNALRTASYDPDDALARAGIDPSARPETLDLAAFARLYRELR